jgi:hypothetical protein
MENDIPKDILQAFRNRYKDVQPVQYPPKRCPNCGYCPHCGRDLRPSYSDHWNNYPIRPSVTW